MNTIQPSLGIKRDGFTLIEVLVSIGIIAILIAILLPVLGSVRLKSYELKSIRNLGQIGITTGLYTNTYGSYYFGRGGLIRPDDAGNPGGISFPIWYLDRNWPVLVHQIAPWDENYLTWISPRTDPGRWIELMSGPSVSTPLPTSYVYSNSFVANSRNWDSSSGPPVDESAVRAQRPGQVRFPSSKVLMYDRDLTYLAREKLPTDPRPLLFADGSAKIKLDSDATEPVQNRLIPSFAPAVFHDTPMGIEGRDF